MTAIQTLAAQLDRFREDEERLKTGGPVSSDRQLDAAISGRVAMEEAIVALHPADDIDALIAAALLGRLIVDDLETTEQACSQERRLIVGLLAYLERKTGRSATSVCRALRSERLADFMAHEVSVGGGNHVHH